MSNEIIVLHKKAETLMATIYPTLRNYPKFEHGRLATMILKDCSSIISIIGLAERVKFRRKQRLQEAQSKEKKNILQTLSNSSSKGIS